MFRGQERALVPTTTETQFLISYFHSFIQSLFNLERSLTRARLQDYTADKKERSMFIEEVKWNWDHFIWEQAKVCNDEIVMMCIA